MISLEDLRSCPKTLPRKRRPEFRTDMRHYRMDMPVECALPNIKMTLFLRRLIAFPEDFSVGLRVDTPNPFADFDIVLARYQGPHGGQSPGLDIHDLHNRYHIHFYSQQDLDRRRKNPLVSEKLHASFSSFEGAVVQMLSDWNIEDPNGIFQEERDKLLQVQMDFSSLT